MPAKSYLTALLLGKCPQCREGRIFTYPLYKISRFHRMNDTCPHCGVRLEPEPGFYQGAMFVSYAIAVALIVTVGSAIYFFADNPSEWLYIGAIAPLLVIIAPWNFRASRILFLYWFGGLKYRRNS